MGLCETLSADALGRFSGSDELLFWSGQERLDAVMDSTEPMRG